MIAKINNNEYIWTDAVEQYSINEIRQNLAINNIDLDYILDLFGFPPIENTTIGNNILTNTII